MIIVTGSEGFVGKHVAAALRHLGELLVRIDPRDPDSIPLDKALGYGGITACVHLGAISDTTCEDEAALSQTNETLPLRLANFCRAARIPFLFASSASVYGNGNGPLNAYAKSKLSFDRCMEFAGNPWPWYGLRIYNCYGPGEDHKGSQASMVHQCIEQIHRQGYCEVFWDSDKIKRDFVYIDDVVSVILWMTENRPPSGIYDVGTGVPESFMDLALKVCGRTEGYLGEPYVQMIPFPNGLRGRYQTYTKADLTKLRAAGYTKPFLSLEEGIAKMLQVEKVAA